MKKFFFFALAVATMVACSAPSKLINTATYTKPINVVQPAAAVMADLEVAAEKITYFMIPSKTVIYGGEENVIKTAVREALLANGNADVLVGLNTQIKYAPDGQPESITVTGYPAKYVNFRSPGDEYILNLKADEGTSGNTFGPSLPFMKKK